MCPLVGELCSGVGTVASKVQVYEDKPFYEDNEGTAWPFQGIWNCSQAKKCGFLFRNKLEVLDLFCIFYHLTDVSLFVCLFVFI